MSEGVPTTPDSEAANSVVVGMFRGITYDLIAEAADAVRRGARFIATNADPTYPSRGTASPGCRLDCCFDRNCIGTIT